MGKIPRSLLVLWVFILLFRVSADAVSATSASFFGTVSRDSGCQVTLSATVHVDQSPDTLEFPLPESAADVTVNGARTRTTVHDGARFISLHKIIGQMTGDFSLNITYTLPDVIHYTEDGTLEMQLPLLSGFAYPIDAMEFSVTLPGPVDFLPSFRSGYHQANIERVIQYTVEGATVSGTCTEPLKDHETLLVTLPVTADMFPQTLADTRDFSFGITAMGVCAAVALLYWLLTMRFWPFRSERSTKPPHGITAGEMGCVLNLQGVDLHLTVLSWAQLGYLLIHVDRHGKVTLHKCMDMGNERKSSERKLFEKLFARGQRVDTASARYASLCAAAAGHPIGVRELMHRRSGNPNVFRALCAGIGLFGGVCMAIAMSGGAVLQSVLIVVLGVLGALSGWYVQNFGRCFGVTQRYRLLRYFLVCAAWLSLGALAGAFSVAALMVSMTVAAGLLYSWGGRRSEVGRQTAAQIMGLRSYMRTADPVILQRLCTVDPDYFFALAPYAMALGVDTAFAKRFGGVRLGACPYLKCSTDANLSAQEWIARLRNVTARMDERVRGLMLERLARMVRRIKR